LKKEAKTFAIGFRANSKSFLVLFFKKELLHFPKANNVALLIAYTVPSGPTMLGV
jgi:hypothetical protein